MAIKKIPNIGDTIYYTDSQCLNQGIRQVRVNGTDQDSYILMPTGWKSINSNSVYSSLEDAKADADKRRQKEIDRLAIKANKMKETLLRIEDEIKRLKALMF